MNQKAFRHLLKKYLDNSCSPEEKRIIDQWYELLENEHRLLTQEELTDVESRLWHKIQSGTAQKGKLRSLNRTKVLWLKYALAACCIAIIVAGGIVWLQHQRNPSNDFSVGSTKIEEGFATITNDADTVRNVLLEDGSTVLVNPGSTLAFPKHFTTSKREVYLKGEAFFDITKDPGRPFFVYNNQLVTRVLGTSFRVSSKAGEIEVAVRTGRVAVYENKEQMDLNEAEQKSNGVIVTPNQKVTYYQQERHFVTSIVERPLPVNTSASEPIAKSRLTYNDTPLSELLDDLERTYQLEIMVENEKIQHCLFTGDLTGESLFNKLEVVCVVFGISYEIKGTKILLKGGKDCTHSS